MIRETLNDARQSKGFRLSIESPEHRAVLLWTAILDRVDYPTSTPTPPQTWVDKSDADMRVLHRAFEQVTSHWLPVTIRSAKAQAQGLHDDGTAVEHPNTLHYARHLVRHPSTPVTRRKPSSTPDTPDTPDSSPPVSPRTV